MQCASHLKQIGLAAHSYQELRYDAAKGEKVSVTSFPSGTVANPDLPAEQRLSWYVELLPYLEQEQLYKGADLKAAWNAPANAALAAPLPALMCSDYWKPNSSSTPYVGVAGLGADAATLPLGHARAGVLGYDRRIRPEAVSDGTSNTLMVLESTEDRGAWAQGGPASVRGLDPARQPYVGMGQPFGGTHFSEGGVFTKSKPAGFAVLVADGSVRHMNHDVAPQLLEALATAAGREPTADGW